MSLKTRKRNIKNKKTKIRKNKKTKLRKNKKTKLYRKKKTRRRVKKRMKGGGPGDEEDELEDLYEKIKELDIYELRDIGSPYGMHSETTLKEILIEICKELLKAQTTLVGRPNEDKKTILKTFFIEVVGDKNSNPTEKPHLYRKLLIFYYHIKQKAEHTDGLNQIFVDDKKKQFNEIIEPLEKLPRDEKYNLSRRMFITITTNVEDIVLKYIKRKIKTKLGVMKSAVRRNEKENTQWKIDRRRHEERVEKSFDRTVANNKKERQRKEGADLRAPWSKSPITPGMEAAHFALQEKR